MGLNKTHLSIWRKARDSNPRTCYSQQFSRLPHSTTLPAFRRQKYELRLNLQTMNAFFLYKLDNYLTQREKKIISSVYFLQLAPIF
jgi:hypothetical protein